MYMNVRAVWALYGLMKARPHEKNPHNTWMTILSYYFKSNEYIISYFCSLGDDGKHSTVDVTVLGINNDELQKVLLVETRPVQDEGRPNIWIEACEQLPSHVFKVRASDNQEGFQADTLNGIVTVGRYSRFYEIPGGKSEMQDYAEAGGETLEFKEDEAKIDSLLKGLVQKVATY